MLLSESKSLTLDQAVEQGRSYEASVTNVEELAREHDTADISVHKFRKTANTCRNCAPRSLNRAPSHSLADAMTASGSTPSSI